MVNLTASPYYQSTRTDSYDWKGDYQIWVPLLLASWAFAYGFQDSFVSDWDGFDYAAYAVRNVPSSMGLGRALFLGYNHLLWEMAHNWLDVPPERAYLVLRYGVIAQSGPAIVGIYALYKELTASRLAATCGALMVALSPFYVVYSGRGMTEIPAFLILGWSLWWVLRSLRLKHMGCYYAAAALFGLSANMREFVLFYWPVIPLAAYINKIHWRRWLPALAITVLAMLAGAIFWSLYRPDYYPPAVMTYLQMSALEGERNPVTTRNLWLWARYSLLCSAIATVIAPFALIQVRKRLREDRRLLPLLLLGTFGLLADLALLANRDLPVNPRYFLTGLIGLAAISGWCLAQWIKRCSGWNTAIPAAIAICLMVRNLSVAYPHLCNRESARAASEYLAKLEGLPAEAVFIVGARTPLVNFYNGVGARPLWKTIPAGAGWPDERLNEVIDGYLADGIPVYVDFEQSLWDPGPRSSREAAGLERIMQDYQLSWVRSPLLYQISKKEDTYP
jgi:hypothetical protein